MAVTHSTVVVVADDGTSPVGTDEWNASHTIAAGTVVNADVNASAAIALSKLAAQADQTILGNVSGGSAVPIALTVAQHITMLTGQVGGPAKIIERTGNSAARTNNTLVNDDVLILPVGATDRWFVELFLLFSSANATMDGQVAFSVPTNGVFTWARLSASDPGAAASWTPPPVATTPAPPATTGAIAFGSNASSFAVAFAGRYVGDGSNAGNLIPQWAQSVTNASNLVMLAGSLMRCTRLA